MHKNLFLLTEERPKTDVVEKILDIYCCKYKKEFKKLNINIKPIILDNILEYYLVEGYSISNIFSIKLKLISGYSSFVDYLLFESTNDPNPEEAFRYLKMAIEETKTDSGESRNTAAGQRATKFAFLSHYKDKFSEDFFSVMLYNDHTKQSKVDTDSVRFMKRCMKTMNVEFYGDNSLDLYPFSSIDELIQEKNSLRKPPPGNVPVRITKKDEDIYISGRLSKPANKGNIGHDPNVGQITGISSALRQLGHKGKIIVTHHAVKQSVVNNMSKNKFTIAATFLDINLSDGIKLPENEIDSQYWKYEMRTEKVSSILLHMICDQVGYKLVYENHAGSERGYFYDEFGNKITVAKKYNNKNINLPDYVFRDNEQKKIYIVEAEMHENLDKGLEQIKSFDLFEELFVKKYFPHFIVSRVICLSNSIKGFHHPKVIFGIDRNNELIANEITPKKIKDFT